MPVREIRNNGPEARKFAELASASDRRSVYLPLLRGLVPTSLEVFDFAEQGMVTGSRDATTVATQALYLLNDPFVRKQALAVATRALATGGGDDARVTLAYRLTLGREPTESEKSRVLAFVADYESAARQVAPDEPKPAEKPAAQVATADTDAGGGNAKPKPPVNPDEVVAEDAPFKEEKVQAATPREAAWASFCAALIGSTEFRYLK